MGDHDVVLLLLWAAFAVVSVGAFFAILLTGRYPPSQRDASGYLTSNAQFFNSPGYAVTSNRIDLGTSEVIAPSAVLGTVRFRVTPGDGQKAIFVGVAPRSEVASYLSQVPHSVITKWTGGGTEYVPTRSAPPGVAVTADAAASLPSLGWITAGLLGAGAALLVAGAVLVLVPMTRTTRRIRPGAQPNG